MASDPLPHPITGQPFASPVPPGTGWPGDPATASTPVATTPDAVARLAATASRAELDAAVTVCRACPRLVAWREDVAATKRSSFADQPYWGRPVASFGDPDATALVVGLAPAAHGANRTGRMFTGDRSGDWLYAALHRAGFASQPDATHAGDGLELTGLRIIAPVHCAPPDNKPTTEEKATCAPWLDRDLQLAGTHVTGRSWRWGPSRGTPYSARPAAWRGGFRVPKPSFGHGAEATLALPNGNPVRLVGCYHVSQQNTFTGKLTEPMLDAAIARLRP